MARVRRMPMRIPLLVTIQLKEGLTTMKMLTQVVIIAAAALFSLSSVNAGVGDNSRGKIVPRMNIKEVKIIRLNAVTGINPEVLRVGPGTTVIWINESESPVHMQFEGKQVTLACKSPVHFVEDEQGSFISDRIPSGAVASLCFVEKGEYHYVMRKILLSSPDLAAGQNTDTFKGGVIVK
jgi:plastocyanin